MNWFAHYLSILDCFVRFFEDMFTSIQDELDSTYH